jgi:hypothetical protein
LKASSGAWGALNESTLKTGQKDAGPTNGGIAMVSRTTEKEPRHYRPGYLIEALTLPAALVLVALAAALWCFVVRWS